ncbi:MAG: hypothetical protein M3394_00440 [Actinomycetota bacterium]|nr:hypothetical protein [Actinomycetota bacterium]
MRPANRIAQPRRIRPWRALPDPRDTIVGIPLGIASFKMAGLALAPFGKEIVTVAELRRRGAPRSEQHRATGLVTSVQGTVDGRRVSAMKVFGGGEGRRSRGSGTQVADTECPFGDATQTTVGLASPLPRERE